MAVTKRNALLKELSNKLKDQISTHSTKTFGALPDTSSFLRSEVLHKRQTLYERSMNYAGTVVSKPEL